MVQWIKIGTDINELRRVIAPCDAYCSDSGSFFSAVQGVMASLKSLKEKMFEARDLLSGRIFPIRKFFSWQLPGKVFKQLVISRVTTN